VISWPRPRVLTCIAVASIALASCASTTSEKDAAEGVGGDAATVQSPATSQAPNTPFISTPASPSSLLPTTQPAMDEPVEDSATQPLESSTIPSTAAPQVSSTIAEPVANESSLSCAGPNDYLVTASGRRVLVRAAGVTGPAPTIFVLHGYTGTSTGIERVSDVTEAARTVGIVVAYPEGTPTERDGFGWNSGAAVFANSGVDDLATLGEMIDVLIASGCTDPSRVILAGESNGAGMALRAICDAALGNRFRSAVMVIPAIDDGVLGTCGTSTVPIPLSAVAGAVDRTAPLDGGNGLLAQLDWFERVARSLRGCTTINPSVEFTQFVTRAEGGGCGTCTELFVVADGPHTWPGARQGTAGLVPGTFDLNSRLIASALAPEPTCIGQH
jgi:poly(3-hydroxybutyrate) depolymerase